MSEGIELNITFSINGKGVISPGEGFSRLAESIRGSRDDLGQVFKEEVRLFLQQVADATVARNSGGYRGGTTSTSVSRRSGRGIASIKSGVEVTGSSLRDVKGTISGLGYMLTQEEGALNIVPKKGKFLCIPLDAALNSDGTPKRISVQLWKEKTFLGKSRDGTKLIIYLKLSGTQIVPLYLLTLKHSVPARLGLRAEAFSKLDAFTERLASRILSKIGEQP